MLADHSHLLAVTVARDDLLHSAVVGLLEDVPRCAQWEGHDLGTSLAHLCL